MTFPKEFLTPVGRLVQGSVLELQTKDRNGQPLTVKQGLNMGQATQRAFIAVAFPKTQAVWWAENAGQNADGTPNTFWQDIYNAARTGYPQHFNPQTGECTHPKMAFKVMDGDGRDDDGNDNRQKEGFAGNWIVKFSSTFLPKAWANGAYTQDVNVIKRGYFVRVAGSMKPNTGSQVPGVYLNHNGVELIAYGQEIVSGPNVGAVFQQAGRPVQLPPGASLTPPTPAVSNMPGNNPAPMGAPAGMSPMPGAGVGASAQPPAMAPMQQPMAQPIPPAGAPAGLPPMPGSMPPPSGVTPNHGFVNNVAAQPPAMPPAAPPAMAPVAPAAPVYQMTAAAGGFTREQYHANQWTDEVLLQRGFMVRVA